MSSTLQYIPLKIHSDYSLLQSTLKIDDIINFAVQEDLPAIGICDNANLFGALEFSETCAKKDIQPIISINLPVLYTDADLKINSHTDFYPHLTLTCMSENGYKNLLHLSSLFYENLYEHKYGAVKLDDIFQHNKDLLLLSGGYHGLINTLLASNRKNIAKKLLNDCQKHFDDRIYIEIQKSFLKHNVFTFSQLIDVSDELSLPTIAISESYFKKKTDIRNHQILLAIKQGMSVEELKDYDFDESHSLLSSNEIIRLFKNHDYALKNTVELAKRIHFRPHGAKPKLPSFLNKKPSQTNTDVLEEEKRLLQKQSHQKLKEKLSHFGLAKNTKEDDYIKQLDYEISVICNMEYAGYFLIVADFVAWAKSHDIPVGPGRGSGAGSLVAYSLDITTIDPLRFGLIFERFLNPDRISMPDFDIDFCQENRDKIIEYVNDKYGNSSVGQIITFGKMQARAVLRDVGRAMGLPYGYVDKFCKLIPNNPTDPITLDKALATTSQLIEAKRSDNQAKELFEVSQNLEGLNRHTSIHAAGIVIASEKISHIVPMYKDNKSHFNITQFSMKWVEHAGLVKFDFLGLKTLSIIKQTEELLALEGINIDINTISLDNKKTFSLLSRAETVGIFQLESTGMKDALTKLKIDKFEDLIALISLYRPGPMDNLPSFIARKNNKENIEYMHPLMEESLKETYGIIIYQEQVMQIARVLGGYSLGEADILRRAMGKKDKLEMTQQKNRFIQGAHRHNINQELAEDIFHLIEKFAGYGFNKSHAAAYAVISYQTAYLKTHYPVHFIISLLNLDIHNTDKIYQFINDAQKQSIQILPPDINHSYSTFKPENSAIRYALGAIKNVSILSCENIVKERDHNGLFLNLRDFLSRVDSTILNKKILENFIKAGVFDCFNYKRVSLLNSIETMLNYATLMSEKKNSNQTDLFIKGHSQFTEEIHIDIAPETQEENTRDKLNNEKDSFGFYLSGHPVENYRPTITQDITNSKRHLNELDIDNHKSSHLIVLLSNISERKSKKGKSYAFINFSDEYNEFEAIIFGDELEKHRSLITVGDIYTLKIESTKDNGQYRHKILELIPINVFLDKKTHQKNLTLRFKTRISLTLLKNILQNCSQTTQPNEGTQISILFPVETLNYEAKIEFSKRYILKSTDLDTIIHLKDIEMIEHTT